jgi:hypothetical protein
MSYKRRYTGLNSNYNYKSNVPTRVTIHWSMSYSAYAIKFENTYHWEQMQIFIQYLKNLPYGERDYDPDNKIWYLMEKHLSGFKQMLEMIPQHFTVDFVEKPSQTFQGNFVSVDTYLDKFQTLTTYNLRTLDYEQAKKIYRKAALLWHPDRNNGDASRMTDINECWSNIEKLHYNVKKEAEYANS